MTRRLLVLALLLGACAPQSGKPDVIARTDLASACARLGACVPGAEPPTLGACASATADERATLTGAYACVNAAGGDCAAILACLAGMQPATACASTDAPACLDPAQLWQCHGGTPLVLTCAAPETCVTPSAGGVAACGRQACGESAATICEGERLVSCAAGVLAARACPPGTRCQGEAGAPACAGTGAACAADAPARCEGSTLVTCVNGHDAAVDCADGVLASCGVGSDGLAACVASGGECGAGFVERCNGVRLEYCMDGRIAGLDCRALGFAGCRIGDPVAGVASRCAAAGVAPAADAAVVLESDGGGG